jgi:hypothetical protein
MGIQNRDLIEIRQTIYRHQWKEFFPLARTLLAKNVLQSTLFVANEMARSSLRFQQNYDLGWVVKFADEVARLIQMGFLEDELPVLPVELDGRFVDTPPGVSNFVAGVEAFWKSFAVAYEPDKKANYLLEALDNFLIGELCHYWAIVHPEEWELSEVFWNAETDSEGTKLLPPGIDRDKMYVGMMFLKQPESVGYKAATWLNLADELEIILDE